jgi:flavorubredoxin
MALVKSKKTVPVSVSLPLTIKSEMDSYATWADVSHDDIVAHALELLFEQDDEWVEKKNPGLAVATMGKTAFVREVYAEIASGKHQQVKEKAGNIKSGSVSKVIKEVYGRDDIAYGTCTAQTSWANRLVRNEANERSVDPDGWKSLRTRVQELGGQTD